ncbi:unnamed protein product [Candida parapsilosis]
MVKALLAVSSYHGPFYPNGDHTGVFASEAIEPFLELAQKGTLLTIEDIAKKEVPLMLLQRTMDSFSVVDGKIVTGVNPQSAFATVRDAIVALESVNN